MTVFTFTLDVQIKPARKRENIRQKKLATRTGEMINKEKRGASMHILFMVFRVPGYATVPSLCVIGYQ